MHSGLLLIDKTPDCTSHDVVQTVRRTIRQKKVGHCGTLDPAATGLLVLTLGLATRLTRFLINAPKTYSGVIAFGASTDTYDASGTVTSERPIDGLEAEALADAMAAMVGVSEQAAPPYSAKKIQGVKYYELARRGKEVPTALKQITIFDFERTEPLENGRLAFRLACSSGTYVRSIAHDLGETLGCGAHLESLRRLAVGPFAVEAATTADALEAGFSGELTTLGPAWISFDEIPLPFSTITADPQQERRIRHGQTIVTQQPGSEEGDWLKLVNQRRQLVAVGSVVESLGDRGLSVIRPRIVFR